VVPWWIKSMYFIGSSFDWHRRIEDERVGTISTARRQSFFAAL